MIKKIGKVLLVVGFVLLLGLIIASYIICENTFPAWIVLIISTLIVIISLVKQQKKLIVFGSILLLIIANVGVFYITNRISFMGGIITKVVVPIVGKQVGQSYDMNREDTLKLNEANANEHWDIPQGYEYKKINRNGYTIETLESKENTTDNVILLIHGGAFCRGIDNSYRDLAVTYSKIGEGALVVIPDYTTSEKAPYPAALNDCIDTYKWIIEQGYKSQNIIITGDSAGGNLVLALTLYLRDNEMPLPAGIITLSPVTDHNFSSESCYEKAEVCVLGSHMGGGNFNPKNFFYTAVDGIDLNDPYLSPAFGDYTGFPPMLMQVGTREVLLDDTRVVAEKAKKVGVDVTETEYYQMIHVFQIIFQGKFKESNDAWKEIEEFIEKVRAEA